MATAFKDLYTASFINDFAAVVKEVNGSFNKGAFINNVFSPAWTTFELKQRMRQLSSQLIKHSGLSNIETLHLILSIKRALVSSSFPHNGIEFMFLPDVIELIGLDHFKESVDIIEELTEFISCEFAVRPFIIKDQKSMMEQMVQWSDHVNHHVRRLSTEGCRPRLPWAMGLPAFKKEPTPILPILTRLKDDTSEYVRKSVANNLNDISKDHPDLIMSLAKKWSGKNKNTDWVLKHGLRTLLKQNYPGVMGHIGYENHENFQISALTVNKKIVDIGDTQEFSFSLENKLSKRALIRLEYAIYFQLSNGNKGKKVFKISERYLEAKDSIRISKKHSFREITTRTYYSGDHELGVIVCGVEKARISFKLR